MDNMKFELANHNSIENVYVTKCMYDICVL